MASDKPVIDQRFQIFEGGYEDVSLESERYLEFRPIAKIDRGQSIDIAVPRSGSYYYDLSRSFLKVQIKLSKNNEGKLTAEDKVGLVNQPLWSIFQAMTFSIENVDFCRSTGQMLGYKSLLDSLMYRSTEYLESIGQSALFYKDTAGAMNATDPNPAKGVNQGLLNRYQYTKSGGIISLRAPLAMDLAESMAGQYLPNAMEMRVRLWPQKDAFCVMSSDATEKYEIHIETASLFLMAITPSPRMLQLHSEEFKKKNAVYHYDKSVLKSYSIKDGARMWEMDSLFGSSIPKEIVVCFVTTTGFLGSQTENPYFFENFKVQKVSFDVEGLVSKNLEPDFDNFQYTEEYNNLYSSPTGVARSGIISLNDFRSGYTIFRLILYTCI